MRYFGQNGQFEIKTSISDTNSISKMNKPTRVLVFACLIIFGPSVRADVILNSIGNVSLTPVLQTNGFNPILISISSNAAPPSENVINAFSVGIIIVPAPGAVGSLYLQNADIPLVDPVFPGYLPDAISGLRRRRHLERSSSHGGWIEP